jgi:hypothetical protein
MPLRVVKTNLCCHRVPIDRFVLRESAGNTTEALLDRNDITVENENQHILTGRLTSEARDAAAVDPAAAHFAQTFKNFGSTASFGQHHARQRNW